MNSRISNPESEFEEDEIIVLLEHASSISRLKYSACATSLVNALNDLSIQYQNSMVSGNIGLLGHVEKQLAWAVYFVGSMIKARPPMTVKRLIEN
jgi:hypothetical protein